MMLYRLARLSYGVYAALAFVAVILLAFCPILIALPWLPARRFVGRWAVRSWLLVIGARFRVRGLEHLPPGPCVVVCNHASYVDGIALTAALPERFTFLVQHRAGGWPYVGLIIRRMGVRLVNREQPRAAAGATLGLVRDARRGGSFAIFPEGTFQPQPGLLPFYDGAFYVAAKAGIPVVPAVIRGSRQLLPDGEVLPAPSDIEIELFPALAPMARSRADARRLKRQAYDIIHRHCGEAVAPLYDDSSFATQGS